MDNNIPKFGRCFRDIETIVDPIPFFCDSFECHETGTKITFEISSRTNQIKEYCDFLEYLYRIDSRVMSFNGIHFDTPVSNYIYINREELFELDYVECCQRINSFASFVIDNDGWWNDEDMKKYKYGHTYTDIDFFTLWWAKKSRRDKKISLKSLGIQLNYPIVQEMPKQLLNGETEEEFIRRMLVYNSIHDINLLKWILTKPVKVYGKTTTTLEQIYMRVQAIHKYGFSKYAYSWDGVKLGLNILLHEYCSRTNQDEHTVKNSRGSFSGVKLEDIILPQIKFKKRTGNSIRYGKDGSIRFSSFYEMFNHLKERTVYSTNELDYSVLYNGVKYDIKSGGLHSYHNASIVEPTDAKIIDADCSSYYPTLGAVYGFTPDHLPGMADVVGEIKNDRVKAKHSGDYTTANLFKLALNGGYYGQLNSSYSFMYDPAKLLSVTINGQLFLLMLAEMCEEEGIKVDSCNTDGVTFIVKPDQEEIFYQVCNKWMELSKMELEYEEYTKIIRLNINNYLAIKPNGKAKEKGQFVCEPDFGNSVNFLVIPKAIKAYFMDGIKPEDFISRHNNIFDFCGSFKVDKSFEVVWNNELQPQRLNRFYISKYGAFLYKRRKVKKDKLIHMLKDWSVQLYNDHYSKDLFEYSINYRFYLSQINSKIAELNTCNQLELIFE